LETTPSYCYTIQLLHTKVFLQSLWKHNFTWDEQLPEALCQEFYKLFKLLQEVSTIKIPCFVGTTDHDSVLVFCDASTRSYGDAVYLRVISSCGPFTNLVFCKMRLALVVSEKKRKGQELNEISLPCLELLGVLIGVRASKFVVTELKFPVRKRYLWTDSECVLHWIKTTKLLPTLVENHIKEIKRETDITFRYVSSKQNPADYVTRGLTVPEIINNDLWWHGPEWLKLIESTWPSWNVPDLIPEALLTDSKSNVIYDVTNVVN